LKHPGFALIQKVPLPGSAAVVEKDKQDAHLDHAGKRPADGMTKRADIL
jgi:hypothetical protein